MEVLSDNSRQLKAIYRLLGSDYEYISYEIKESGSMWVHAKKYGGFNSGSS